MSNKCRVPLDRGTVAQRSGDGSGRATQDAAACGCDRWMAAPRRAARALATRPALPLV